MAAELGKQMLERNDELQAELESSLENCTNLENVSDWNDSCQCCLSLNLGISN